MDGLGLFAASSVIDPDPARGAGRSECGCCCAPCWPWRLRLYTVDRAAATLTRRCRACFWDAGPTARRICLDRTPCHVYSVATWESSMRAHAAAQTDADKRLRVAYAKPARVGAGTVGRAPTAMHRARPMHVTAAVRPCWRPSRSRLSVIVTLASPAANALALCTCRRCRMGI